MGVPYCPQRIRAVFRLLLLLEKKILTGELLGVSTRDERKVHPQPKVAGGGVRGDGRVPVERREEGEGEGQPRHEVGPHHLATQKMDALKEACTQGFEY